MIVTTRGKHVRDTGLDLIRGLAAVAVCVGHARNGMLLDYDDLGPRTLPLKAFYFATGLGHQAVMVFFVLSGFLVGGAVIKRGAEFSVLDYFVARLARLWVVLLPALCVTAAVSVLLAWKFPETMRGSYVNVWHSGPSGAGGYSDSILTFLGNMMFLQTIAVPTYGTNGPLWSLANEFWYYVLFPLVALAFGVAGRNISFGRRILLGSVAIAFFGLLPREIKYGWSIWCLGVVVWWLKSRRPGARRSWSCMAFAVTTFAASLALGRAMSAGYLSDAIVGIGAGNLVFWFAGAWRPRENVVTSLVHRLSDCSYSIYLLHFPLLVVILSVFRGQKREPDLLGISWCMTLSMMLLASGLCFWWFFERHTETLKRIWLHRLVGSPSPSRP